ncbi:MAG: PAS domain S-box protein [Caulobacteraceae bacterium]
MAIPVPIADRHEGARSELSDFATDVVVRFNLDNVILEVSPSCRRFGYEPEDLVGQRGLLLTHPDDRERVQRFWEEVISGAELDLSADREQRVRTKDGQFHWMEGVPSLRRDAEGRPFEVISVVRDVSQRRALRAQLKASEERYRLIAEHARDLIVRYDTAGLIEYVSPSISRLGFAPEEIIGRNLTEFQIDLREVFSTEGPDDLFAAPGDPPRRRMVRMRTRDGAIRSFEGKPTTIFGDDGRPVGAISILRDVTERLALEEELRAKRAEAEQAAQANADFLANMSHEIRTPLTGVLGYARLLAQHEALQGREQTFVERILSSGETLLNVVNDILDFSKLQSGHIELDPRPFELREFIAETLDLLRAQAEYKNIWLRAKIDETCPVWVQADSARLRQVLLNLISNGIKFTAEGGVTLHATHGGSNGEELRIEVRDTGAGIAPERLGLLFKRFSQTEASVSRVHGGTGLGLAISKSLAELMGGQMGVESTVGEGSVFWFNILAAPAGAGADLEEDDKTIVAIASLRILIVDDTAVNRELVATLLKACGHQTVEASGGEEALALARSEHFDLILMDMQMPGMDGIAATRAIRRLSRPSPSMPIIAVSANVLDSQMNDCLAAGMNDHVAKPIDVRQLLAKIAFWTSPDAPVVALRAD